MTKRATITDLLKFQTERMAIDQWDTAYPEGALANISAELQAMLTPNTLAFLPPSMQLAATPTASLDWVAARKAESNLFAIRAKQTEYLLGLLILNESSNPDYTEIRLGYLFAEQHWSKGYATELLKGLAGWCHRTKHPLKLVGGVEKGNRASARALEKAGFTVSADLSSKETDTFQYDFDAN